MNPVGRRGEQRRGADGCGQRRLYLSAAAALLRYAHFLDGHFEFETDFLAHQAEGLAFWRILEAAVAQVDPERAALITAAFTSSEPEPLSPSNYCYIVAAPSQAPKLRSGVALRARGGGEYDITDADIQ